jgi:hypothetical protein
MATYRWSPNLSELINDKTSGIYYRYILDLADTNSEDQFVFSDKDESIFVFTLLFAKATTKIKLLVGDLNQGIANSIDYQEALNAFLQKGGKVEILMQQYNPASEPEIFKLFRFHDMMGRGENIKIRSTDYFVEVDGKEVHFCIADNMYRLEDDITRLSGHASFDNPAYVKSLSDIFDPIFNSSDQSTEIPLKPLAVAMPA